IEGKIFSPMARTYGYALTGALIATFTITPVLASILLPKHVDEAETMVVRALHRVYSIALRWSLAHRRTMVAAGLAFLTATGL
ncbi:efflux RND transporter permease subunit, partial [Klebsiella pneumoniae]|nr:efflux RND transporter permease subunit [Klebsiella pneumoniae]